MKYLTEIRYRILYYLARDSGCNFLEALESISYFIRHIHAKNIRFITDIGIYISYYHVFELKGHIGFCILRYHMRDKIHDLILAWGSASYIISHEIGIRFDTGIDFSILYHQIRISIYYGHGILHIILSYL